MSILDQLKESCDYIHTQTHLRPRLAIVLGSGLSTLIKDIDQVTSIPFSKIPHFPQPLVQGHSGTMEIGYLDKKPLIVMKGRVHLYEGYSIHQVVYPTRCLSHLGVKSLILTNAAGGIAPHMQPGHLMLIKDHINLTGDNPLIGPNDPALGPRFPDMSQPYNRKLITLAKDILSQSSLPHSEGVYCGTLGPSYETPSEVEFIQKIGGHAVGMSTVPETIAAVHMGVRVCGMSCISNLATGIANHPLSHEKVDSTAQSMKEDLYKFIRTFIGRVA